MSNARHLTSINKGSGQMARPRNAWKGFRPPRSVKQRHLIAKAQERLMKQLSKGKLRLPKMEDTNG